MKRDEIILAIGLFLGLLIGIVTHAQMPQSYLRVDSAGITIPTGSFVALDASTDAKCEYLDVLNGVAQPLLLSIGAADSPIPYVLPPSMPQMLRIKVPVPRGVKLGAKSLGSAGSTGIVYVNCLQ